MFRQAEFYDDGLDELGFEYDTTDFMSPIHDTASSCAIFPDEQAMECDVAPVRGDVFKSLTEWAEEKAPTVAVENVAQQKPYKFIYEYVGDTAKFASQASDDKQYSDAAPYSYQRARVVVNGKLITMDALRKRNYVFVDDGKEVPKADKNRITVLNNKAYLDGRELHWNSSIGQNLNPSKLKIDGCEITKSAFYKRKYFFKDTKELVTNREKNKADITPDKIYVDGREIVYQPGVLKRKRDQLGGTKTKKASSDEAKSRESVPVYTAGAVGTLLFFTKEKVTTSTSLDENKWAKDRAKRQRRD